jgi:hypothetical protein
VRFWRPQIQKQDSDGRPYSQAGLIHYTDVRFMPALRGKVIREQTQVEYQKNMIESRQIKQSKI